MVLQWISGIGVHPNEAGALNTIIHELLNDGINPGEITLLSPVRFEISVARSLKGLARSIVDLAGASSDIVTDAIQFSTIQAFKGMETSVGVMIDLHGIEDTARQALLYVGMSRARSHLVMLVHQSFKIHVEVAVRRRLGRAI